MARHAHFSMVRSFHLADLITLLNGACGMLAILTCLDHVISNVSITPAFYLLPLGGFFDWLDGRIARLRNATSLLGQELDSLCDLLTFGVAPSVLAYTLGMRTLGDKIILVVFALCGLARLARYNATVASIPKGEKGAIKYFEGIPVPSSLFLVFWLYFNQDFTGWWMQVDSSIVFGIPVTRMAWCWLGLGFAMVSRTLRIPKL